MEVSNQSAVNLHPLPSTTDLSLNISILILGFWTMATNGILLLFSTFNQRLKKQKQYLRLALFAANVVYGLGQVAACGDRLRLFYLSTWYTAYYCLAINIGSFFGNIFSLLIVWSMALERLVAIGLPYLYRNTNKKMFSLYLIMISLAITGLCSGFQYYGVDNSKKPAACTGTGARISQMKPFLSYFNCAVGCLTVILYAIVVAVMKIRSKKFGINAVSAEIIANRNSVESHLQREIQAAKIVTIVVMTNFLFLILPNILLTIVTAEGVLASSNIGQYVAVLAVCNSSVNVFLYICMDKNIRKAFFNSQVSSGVVS